VLELLVHVEPADIPDDMRLLGIEVPDDLEMERPPVTALPSDWQATPAPASTRAIGDAWLAAGLTAVLVVPSVVLPRERNYLLNPAHRDAQRIDIASNEPFTFDQRLVGDADA
jgi:RES domain-containing protein